MDKKYIIMRNPQGNLTFTFAGDDRLETVFSEWEKFHEINEFEHANLIERMNICEWNKKFDIIDGEVLKIDKYTPEEEAIMSEEMRVASHKAMYLSERSIAIKIIEDYSLDFEDITNEDIIEVKAYIKAIKPSDVKTMDEIVRPEIMNRYNRG